MNASPSTRRDDGFTILELTVVMGLLSVFMMFLLQIVFMTTEIFQTGSADQETSARLIAAGRPVEEAVRDMIGPSREDKHQASDARLLVQWLPIGLAAKGASGQIQVLRSTVHVPKFVEKQLLTTMFRGPVVEEIGDNDPQQVRATIEKMILSSGFKGRGEMMLIAWPEGDAEGAYFTLRRGVFLPDQPLPFREADGKSLLEVRDLVTEFPAKHVVQNTEVIATGLLHLSYRLASQYTENWIDGPAGKGPEQVWDSARVGWLVDGEIDTEKFSLDLGEISRTDSTDDVYPRYIEVTVVAAGSSKDLPEGLLAEQISASDTSIRLINTERLPNHIHDRFLKVGSEWVQYGAMRGRTLTGVKRGMRGTVPKNHDRRTGVRAGKTDVMMIKILHARDSWNG
jgi:prepilin-type N-terminal cleavage/methylation domain-containing protein